MKPYEFLSYYLAFVNRAAYTRQLLIQLYNI
nr:MAG TPA: hypothetical protein [Bacteriophage sp.]